MTEFDELYDKKDKVGNPLVWEWDDDQLEFIAYGDDGITYTMKVITAVITDDGGDGEEEEDSVDYY